MANVNTQELVNNGTPQQVMFWDGEGYCAGILFEKKIICGCCGAVYELDEVVDDAMDSGVAPLKLFGIWADLSDEIRGDASDEAKAIVVEKEDL